MMSSVLQMVMGSGCCTESEQVQRERERERLQSKWSGSGLLQPTVSFMFIQRRVAHQLHLPLCRSFEL